MSGGDRPDDYAARLRTWGSDLAVDLAIAASLLDRQERQLQAERALADDAYRFVVEARSALAAATVVGMRSCRPGDGLDYGNHDRLVDLADDLLAGYREARQR